MHSLGIIDDLLFFCIGQRRVDNVTQSATQRFIFFDQLLNFVVRIFLKDQFIGLFKSNIRDKIGWIGWIGCSNDFNI